MMKERPILFNSEMVRAILDGRKTQTRRAVKAPLPEYFSEKSVIDWGDHTALIRKRNKLVEEYRPGFYWYDPTAVHGAWSGPIKCPYEKGDRLWVRETWAVEPSQDDKRAKPPSNHVHGEELCFYKATLESWQRRGKWRPSIHMPRWASRITLEVTDVRVERLQDISEEDANAEGVKVLQTRVVVPFSNPVERIELNHRNYFATLWDDINYKRGFGWDKNPWVWVVEFKVIK
jgi:hypothetical protein